MSDAPPSVALYYDPDGYVERSGAPAGLMGRQVAGQEFLDAYLTYGRWDALAAVVRARARAAPLVELCRNHPSSRARPRRLTIVEEAEFAAPDRPAGVLHFPNPPDPKFAWARRSLAPGAFALCGVTHTLATPAAVEALCELLVAPFEPHDALICTSRAVVDMVRAVTDAHADYIRERFGGSPTLRPRLELIPLGVNTEKFRPPTSSERAEARTRLGATDDEVLVLCVGRLSHHAKAHPYPVFAAAQSAARRTGQKVHLLFAGWAAHPVVAEQYRTAARYFAPAARVSFADGQSPEVRAAVWPAADVFVSLPDNIQETFGLVVVEAMASGLPVVGSDWDGYRDLIADGETGFLVPTRAVRGANSTATARVMFGTTSYDHFLAECCQSVAVDPGAAGEALARVVGDPELRQRMGAAGRARAVEQFGWNVVIRSYERLWAEQARELAATRPAQPASGMFPTIERSFAGYPSAWLDDATQVRAAADAPPRLAGLLAMPLTNLAAERRCSDPDALRAVLRAAAGSAALGDLAALLGRSGASAEAARGALGWLLKYDLLRPA